MDGRPLIAYIVVIDGESVNTIAQITFPVNPRGARTDMSPEPAEQQQIDQLIATMNEAVEDSQASAEESERQAGISGEYATDSEAWAVGQRDGADVDATDETYHNNSKYWSQMAQQAAGKDGWVSFYIDDNGHLHYVKTENAALRFYLENGHLHVTNA